MTPDRRPLNGGSMPAVSLRDFGQIGIPEDQASPPTAVPNMPNRTSRCQVTACSGMKRWMASLALS